MDDVLRSMESATNYLLWIREMARPYLAAPILEVGAGHGAMTTLLAEHGSVVATDLSEQCLEVLRGKFGEGSDVSVALADIAGCAGLGTFRSIVAVNVLEHIPDDKAALVALGDALEPGGHVILFVPAFQRLYSDFDRRVGHYRRYERANLTELCVSAGYEIADVRYVNLVGVLAWWLLARQLGITPTKPELVRTYDRTVVPSLRWLERRWSPPMGQSLFCAARKPG